MGSGCDRESGFIERQHFTPVKQTNNEVHVVLVSEEMKPNGAQRAGECFSESEVMTVTSASAPSQPRLKNHSSQPRNNLPGFWTPDKPGKYYEVLYKCVCVKWRTRGRCINYRWGK